MTKRENRFDDEKNEDSTYGAGRTRIRGEMSDVLVDETHGVADLRFVTFLDDRRRFLRRCIELELNFRDRIIVVVIAAVARTARFAHRRTGKRNCALTTGTIDRAGWKRRTRLCVRLGRGLKSFVHRSTRERRRDVTHAFAFG